MDDSANATMVVAMTAFGFFVTELLDDDTHKNVKEGNDLDHHASISTLEDGSAERVDELGKDARNEEHRDTVSTKVGKDGISSGEHDHTV